MMDLKGVNVLITGPTTGIGLELARGFAAEGANLILVSKNAERLRMAAESLKSAGGAGIQTFQADLALPGSPEKLAEEITRSKLRVDVLVNNAGYGVYGKFFEENLDAQMGIIQLQVASPTYLSHFFLKGMLERGRGGILNVASTGAFQPVPIENVYCATKAYLVHFSEALAEELSGTPVTVTCLCPGPTETPFFDTALMKSRLPPRLSRMDAPSVARLGLAAFKNGKALEITGLRNKLMAFSVKLAPRGLVVKAARRIVEKKSSPANR